MVGPAPLREVVIKVHERCNLACDHCYMYEAADQHWRNRPISMSSATLFQLAQRLAEHADAHSLDHLRIVLHGGEPLLVGVAGLETVVATIRERVGPGTRLSFAVQTNGLLLQDGFLELFRRHGVRVGVSIDGNRSANDRHRRHANGRSSFDATIRGIELLARPANRDVYGGLLCTVDVRNDPADTLASLLASAPPRIDFLLPHGNWVYPPPGLAGRGPAREGGPTPYADWLISVFDLWFASDRQDTEIRLFEAIMTLVLGGASDTEAVGLGIPASVVVETDGSIEGNDALKTTGADGGATGLDVFAQSFDDVLDHPTIRASRLGLAGLGESCRSCPVVTICGGGLHAHRFSNDAGFDRPSVYCADLYRLVRHIRAAVEATLARHVVAAH